MFGKKKKVLLLEDDPALSKAISIKLKNEGYDVTSAQTGQEALEFIDKKHFNLIILDLMTPKVSGFDVLKHVRSVDDGVPVFVVTNLSQREDMHKVLSMGANKYFVKSNVSLQEILDSAKEVLG